MDLAVCFIVVAFVVGFFGGRVTSTKESEEVNTLVFYDVDALAGNLPDLVGVEFVPVHGSPNIYSIDL